MPKLFDEFDLDLQKVKSGIEVYSSDDMTLGTDCSGTSSGPTLTITCLITCKGTCVSDCFCPSANRC